MKQFDDGIDAVWSIEDDLSLKLKSTYLPRKKTFGKPSSEVETNHFHYEPENFEFNRTLNRLEDNYQEIRRNLRHLGITQRIIELVEEKKEIPADLKNQLYQQMFKVDYCQGN